MRLCFMKSLKLHPWVVDFVVRLVPPIYVDYGPAALDTVIPPASIGRALAIAPSSPLAGRPPHPALISKTYSEPFLPSVFYWGLSNNRLKFKCTFKYASCYFSPTCTFWKSIICILQVSANNLTSPSRHKNTLLT
jgi:hypothetical protein